MWGGRGIRTRDFFSLSPPKIPNPKSPSQSVVRNPGPGADTLSMPLFDPAAPLPRRTRQNFMATGVGQAAPASLVFVAIACAVGAGLVLVFWLDWWVLATPLVSLACFGSYGLLVQRTYLLDLGHEKRASLRRGLAALRFVAVVIGAASAVAGLIGVTVALSQRGARL